MHVHHLYILASFYLLCIFLNCFAMHIVLTLYSPHLFLNILNFLAHGFCLIRVPKRQKQFFFKIQPIINFFLHCAKFRKTGSRVINYYDYKYFSHVVLLLNTQLNVVSNSFISVLVHKMQHTA